MCQLLRTDDTMYIVYIILILLIRVGSSYIKDDFERSIVPKFISSLYYMKESFCHAIIKKKENYNARKNEEVFNIQS